MQTNIIIPQWLAKDYGVLYTKLKQNISEFNIMNSIPVLDESAWTTQFNLLISSLETWKSTNRHDTIIEFSSIVIGFGAFIEQNKLQTQYKSLLDSAKYTSIFNFNGLATESASWYNSYILNNNNISNLTAIVTKINTALASETAMMTSIKNQMITIIQDKSFQNLVSSDIGYPIFKTRLGLQSLSNLNLGTLIIPTLP